MLDARRKSRTAIQVFKDGGPNSRPVARSCWLKAARESVPRVNDSLGLRTSTFNPNRESNEDIICHSDQPKTHPHLRLRRFRECERFVQSSCSLESHEKPGKKYLIDGHRVVWLRVGSKEFEYTPMTVNLKSPKYR